jgi:hypothetical protein
MPETGSHRHWHACESCGAFFHHRHSKKSEAESKEKYKHLCGTCRSVPEPGDARARLLAYLQTRVAFKRKDSQLTSAVHAIATNWCRDNNITDEREQLDLLTAILPEVMTLTPTERVLDDAATNPAWRASTNRSNLIAEGWLDASWTWKRVGMLMVAAICIVYPVVAIAMVANAGYTMEWYALGALVVGGVMGVAIAIFARPSPIDFRKR